MKSYLSNYLNSKGNSEESKTSNTDTPMKFHSGLEFASKKTIEWKIGEFYKISKRRDLINSQEITFNIDASPSLGLPRTTWTFALYMGEMENNLRCNYYCEGESPIYYEANIVVMSSAGCARSSCSGFQTFAPPKIFKALTIGEIYQLPVVDWALLLQITIDFYRDVGNMGPFTDCWNTTHEHTAKRNLLNLLETGRQSDVKIVSGDGKEFFAHKFILSAGNDVFDAMFRNEMLEATSGTVILKDMSGKAVKFLLHFIYSSEILPISAEDDGKLVGIEEVLHVASKYGLDELMKHLDQRIGTFCNEKNAKDLMRLCKIYSLQKGMDAIIEMMKNYKNLWKDFVLSLQN